MKRVYTDNIVKYAYHGIDENIEADRTVEVNLRDLMKLSATLEELLRFFHQPLHLQTLEDVNAYMGTASSNGAFTLPKTANHETIPRMLPAEVNSLRENGVFDAPELPYYFKGKN